MTLDNFAGLDLTLHRGDKPVPSRKIANHTYAQRRGEAIAIKFHDTDVVLHHPDGSITLDTGTWTTTSTKARMNEFTPRFVQVHTVKGRWYVAHLRKDGLDHTPDYDNSTPYADGMVLTPVGSGAYAVKGGLDADTRRKQDAHNRQIEKLLDKYLRGLDDTKLQNRLTWPNDKDTCSLCLPLIPRIYGKPPRIIGEAMGDTQHLIEHLFEKQYPAGLLKHVAEITNPSGMRIHHLALLKTDLRAYLRSALLVGPISIRGARRVA